MGGDRHAERGKQLTADGTDGNAHRCLACTRSLEDIPRVRTVIFQRTCEIRVSRTDGSHPGPRRRTEGIHALRPVRKVMIHNLKRDGRTKCLAKAQPRKNRDAIRFDLHAVAAPIPLLPPRQLCIDHLTRKPQPRRHAVENRRQRRTMRLAACDKTQLAHAISSPVVSSAIFSSILK